MGSSRTAIFSQTWTVNSSSVCTSAVPTCSALPLSQWLLVLKDNIKNKNRAQGNWKRNLTLNIPHLFLFSSLCQFHIRIFVSLRQRTWFLYSLRLIACSLLKGSLTPSLLQTSRYDAYLVSVYTALPYPWSKWSSGSSRAGQQCCQLHHLSAVNFIICLLLCVTRTHPPSDVPTV